MPGPSNDRPSPSSHALAKRGLTRPAPGQPGVAISGASVRLRALAALSGSLTDALGPQDTADLVEQQALFALGATSAVVVTLGPFPPPLATAVGASRLPTGLGLHVVHAIGLPLEVRAALDELPLDAPVPFAEVARTGAPLFPPGEDALRLYPDWGTAMIGAGARAAAIVPVWANGKLRGVLGLSWAEPRTFDEDERAFVLTLGVVCAQAIMRAHLRDAERVAGEAAEHVNRSKAHFVATISHELRTPMNAILGYTALMGEGIYGPVSADQEDHLGRVRSSGQRPRRHRGDGHGPRHRPRGAGAHLGPLLAGGSHVDAERWEQRPRALGRAAIARLLGGDVTMARSAPGEGSTFVVSLPAKYPGQPERRAVH